MKIVKSGAFAISGLSITEILLVIAVLGVFGSLVIPSVTSLGTSVREQKLESDVSSINRAISIYRAHGGQLNQCKSTEEILCKLKSIRDQSQANVFVGLTGATIDPRLCAKQLEDSNSRVSRAVWNATEQKFEILHQGSGVERFYLDDELAESDYGAETREKSSFDYNAEKGWVWSYRDRAQDPRIGSTAMEVVSVPASPMPASGSAPSVLRPPIFSIGSGTFAATSFPMSLTLSNPNPAGTTIRYSINGGGYVTYANPIVVPAGARIQAFVTGDSELWIDSSKNSGSYIPEDPEPLSAPAIVLSATTFTNSVDSISITLTNPNPGGSSQIRYSIAKTGESFSDPDSWPVYSGPLTVGKDTFPTGFEIQAYSDAIDYRLYYDSPIVGDSAGADFFGLPMSGDILFVIDSSGSMNESWAGGTNSRMDAVLDALFATIRQLGSTQNFNVITFSNGVSFNDGTWQLQQATDANKSSLITRLKTEVATGGGTNYQAAFAAANQFTTVPTRVVFLTDGEDKGESFVGELLKLVDKGVIVDSIGISLTDAGQTRLAEIATATGGTWVNIEDYKTP